MRTKLIAIALFSVCLALAGHSAATPRAGAPSAELTPSPAQYLPIVMNDARLRPITPTPTTTPPIGATVGISGAVYLNPRWVDTQASGPQPVQFLILLDATGSMSWDFNGYGTYDGTNAGPGYSVPNSIRGDVQCDSPSNPNPLSLPFTDRCLGGMNSAWHTASERRVYVLKQALASLVDRMNANDSMQVIAFSTAIAGNAEASGAWSSDKTALKDAVATLGAYAADPYKTTGSASNAIALQKARDLLAAAPTTAPNGQPYRQVLIMLTDSVANVFLDGTVNSARDICANLSEQEALRTANPCQIGTTATGTPRPISAMIDVANGIKTEHPNIALYVVALGQLDGAGLPQVASDPSYYYIASQPSFVDSVLQVIQSQITSSVCIPAGGNQWVDTVDARHLPSGLALPAGVVGYTYIYPANSATPLFALPIQPDPATDKLSFVIPPPDANHPNGGIAPGTYQMMAYVGYKGNDGITRLYDWLFNPNTLTGASRITFTIAPAGLGGPIAILDPLFLDLPPTAHVCP